MVFDVSHLGTVRLDGADAHDQLQRTLTNDLGKIGPGRAQYTHLLDDADASVLDDIIVWWHPADGDGPAVFDVMPNASNTARVVEALGGTDTTRDARRARGAGATGARAAGDGVAAGRGRRPLRRRGGELGGHAVHGRRHRIHRRARRRDRRPRRRGRVGVGGGDERRDRSGRPRRPRHPAPRGGAPVARPRARSRHHAAAGRARVGRGVGQGDLPRSRRTGRRARAGRAPPPRGHRHRGSPAARAPSARSSSTARRSAW